MYSILKLPLICLALSSHFLKLHLEFFLLFAVQAVFFPEAVISPQSIIVLNSILASNHRVTTPVLIFNWRFSLETSLMAV